jgi:SAM-dependent methyltransferase
VRARRRIALAAVAVAAALPASAQPPPAQAAPQIGQVSRDSVWVPTPERVIRRMLQLADVTPGDLVVDLGSGDGRIPIYAARYFGARALGVEIEENLIELSVRAARAQGVEGRVRFERRDLFEADLSAATVIALYISPAVMTRLKPRLLALRPGTRVVSHHFRLEGWEPDESVQAEGRSAYLWVVPADVRGDWTLRSGSGLLRLRIEQEAQRLAIRGERGGGAVPVLGARLRGTEIRFSSFDADGSVRHYSGAVEGGRMQGSSEGPDVVPLAWSAKRE